MDRRGCGRLLRLALLGVMPLSAAAAGLLCARPYGSGFGGRAAYGLGLLLALCMYALLLGLLAVLAASADRARLERAR